MKFLSQYAIVSGSEAEYRRRHDEIWPEMLELIKQAGLKNYSIWLRNDNLVEYFETDDIDRSKTIISQSEVKKRWDAYMRDILILDEDGNMYPMSLVFEAN